MLDLPIEIYIGFLEACDYKTVLTCMRLNKTFHNLIKESSSLMFKIELALANKIPGQSTSIPEARELLRKHQAAWETCTWSRTITVPMPDGTGLWELYGGVLAQTDSQHHLHFTRLPSDIRGIPQEEWSIGQDLGFRVRDFGMDPSQDLLALIESSSPSQAVPSCRVHLRGLKTGQLHPLARNPGVLSIPLVDDENSDVSYLIQISGDYLTLLILLNEEDVDNELVIWNWKTGDIETHVYGDIQSTSLMSQERILIGVLEPYGMDAKFYILNFIKESPEHHPIDEATHADIFRFATPQESVEIAHIEIRADPGPQWQAPADGPFSEDLSERVFVVTYWLQLTSLYCMVQFIPERTFTTLIGKTESPNHCYTTYEWEEWAADQKSLLVKSRDHLSDTWVCYVYGQKYVAFDRDSEDEQLDRFGGYLVDFNSRAFKQTRKHNPHDWECLAGVTKFTGKLLFTDTVRTSLPLRRRRFRVDEAHNHSVAMISEDNIILVDDVCQEFLILVF